MKQKITERLKWLLNKQIQHTIASGEEKELAFLISISDDNQLKEALLSNWKNYESLEILSDEDVEKILSGILSRKGKISVRQKSRKRLFFRYSAAAVTVILITLFAFFNRNRMPNIQTEATGIELYMPSPQEAVDYTRNISLPDGSVVILHKGSALHYGDEFSKTSRELILKGEAYFDVVHKPEQPFIIHCDKVKTTVLGTAFSIKAWPGQERVIVAVVRGKVKVEKVEDADNAILAVLTANQQLSYDVTKAQAQTEDTLQSVNDWIKEEMVFDQVSLKQIVSVLQKRYKTNIIIRDRNLEEKIVVSSFGIAESLVNVLDMLCAIMPGMNYKIDNENIILYYTDDKSHKNEQ
ncbi:MAG: FecR domain-containing protein [Prevotellaceae bacterium]|jgi:ferric-dicitrate binding protein FerR (iron transport regulator)|nr:FecR domain-containing protein [Prevotellaceae bacterium]